MHKLHLQTFISAPYGAIWNHSTARLFISLLSRSQGQVPSKPPLRPHHSSKPREVANAPRFPGFLVQFTITTTSTTTIRRSSLLQDFPVLTSTPLLKQQQTDELKTAKRSTSQHTLLDLY